MRYLAVTCIMLVSISAAVAQMTHEETVVRTAYARLSFAVDLNTVFTAAQANPNIDPAALLIQIEQKGLRFTLSEFSVGNLADIASQDYDVLGQYRMDRTSSPPTP